VRIDAAAAERIRKRGAAIARRLGDAHDVPEREPSIRFSDARDDALAGHGAGNKHDLAIVARNHAPSRRGFLDDELDFLARGEHEL
jgi:hypothetical protein